MKSLRLTLYCTIVPLLMLSTWIHNGHLPFKMTKTKLLVFIFKTNPHKIICVKVNSNLIVSKLFCCVTTSPPPNVVVKVGSTLRNLLGIDNRVIGLHVSHHCLCLFALRLKIPCEQEGKLKCTSTYILHITVTLAKASHMAKHGFSIGMFKGISLYSKYVDKGR